MKKDITYKELSEYLGKSLNTINGWKNKFPELLELCKLGFFCKKNDLDIEKIKKLIEVKQMFSNEIKKDES